MQPSNTPFAFLNGTILPLNQAYLHVSDLTIQRGYGIFDYFKVQDNIPLFLDDYLVRFFRSAELMQLPVPYTQEELKQIIQELLQKNNLPVSGVKMILTGGYSANGYDLANPNLIITQHPLSLPGSEQLKQGIRIITHEYVREIPEAKTINYTVGIRLQQKLKEQEADEVLYHQNGIVTEFPRCNFFIVTADNTIVTPITNVLYGITRKKVLEVAGQKYKTVEGEVPLSAVLEAKEAFLTSTTKRILPIVQVNNQIIGEGKPGSITLGLLADLVALEEEQLKLKA
ncbi:aminotransferase class IV [Adhaeribacter aquaticus]|uniref:aminotransferase class IV n=1 Tax=Adhaeribacter aquaticus TaxID=299567 RepID=UPI0003FB7CC6|nr:aminotransferase class IV [Adhaeribacter aquaticus]